MTERADGLEVDTLTIRIPVRLQRRGGQKLIMTAGGGQATPTPKCHGLPPAMPMILGSLAARVVRPDVRELPPGGFHPFQMEHARGTIEGPGHLC